MARPNFAAKAQRQNWLADLPEMLRQARARARARAQLQMALIAAADRLDVLETDALPG